MNHISQNKKTMTNELEIRTLTTRFFNGETSLDEERRLYELYQSAEELPADLLELREMMLDLEILSKQKPIQQRIAQKPTLNPFPREGSLDTLPNNIAITKTIQAPFPWGGVGGRLFALAASLLLLFGIGTAWYYQHERQNECVAYVYGERVTDRDLVMHEMHTAMASLSDDDATATMESQMKELFSE